jgi:hypothetical protein
VSIDMRSVTPIDELAGEDQEDTTLLRKNYEEASSYISQFKWCRGVKEAYFGAGVGGIVAAFLFRIVPAGKNDEWLWVIVGDLPPAYLVTDQAPTPVDALNVYCTLLDGWIRAVREGALHDDVFPINAPRTQGVADSLAKRVALLREEIIPSLA